MRDWKSRRNLRDFPAALEQQMTLDLTAAMLHLYEHGPCLFCRNRVVRWLFAMNALPKWVRIECAYDTNPETRETVGDPGP